MLRKAFRHGSWFPTQTEFLHALSLLPENDRVVILRYVHQRDVLSRMAGRILMRQVAVSWLSVDSSDIVFDRTDLGRPFVAGYQGVLDLNISHGGEFTTIVSVNQGRCGVDVMRIELPPPEKSAHSFITKLKSVLSPKELNLILSQTTEGEQMRYFYRHWCLKEAYLKAVGCGIRLPLSAVQCTLCLSGDPSVSCGFDEFGSGYWRFEEHSLPGGHLAATAWFKPTPHAPFDEAPCFTEVDFTGLIAGLTRLTDAPEEAWLAFNSKPREPPSNRRVLFADE
ncbi:L-aminoadipate-semialdehyde dehydrogenase-phosphopantetheinyl transferase [Clonorchis sinensis]|uniref:L-aminoadipate-semialdehyde dehydrogenase-phosphopantetheinyl transferase n=2 Tax=Clonorchis sinensis TaxID=79923 RepID=A0A8T1MBS1_CLOSI|nr:L-aminoadipate-semialdehyde dehydrogenase-phosphopantetheinyl transferase [Clonorchis sinensis]